MMSIAKAKKKILFIHHCGTKSGAANSLMALISHLNPLHYERIVLCPEGNAIEAFEKIADKVIAIPEPPEIVSIAGYQWNYLRVGKLIFQAPHTRAIINICKEVKPDLIHLNEISLTPLAKPLKKAGFKVIAHARVVLSHKTGWLNSIIKKRLAAYADWTICIDGSVFNSLQGVEKRSIVYNSYKFSNTELSVSDEHNGQHKFTVLFLANLIRYKGIFDLVTAVQQLKDLPELEVLVAGANSRNDAFFASLKGKVLSRLGIVSDNRKKIQQIISTQQLEAVKLLGHIENISALIQQSDVLIFPSYMNGPSRSIFEAGVLGKPSILALRDKVEDVVEDGKTGLIIPEGAPSAIEAAIREMYTHQNKTREMGIQAKEKYLQLNDPVKNAQKIEEIYTRLLAGSTN